MAQPTFQEAYGGSAAENYERYFVPVIGGPFAEDLIETAALRPGERVLDVACGTGAVTRLAARHVGAGGQVTGLDVNPGMLGVARSTVATAAPDTTLEWIESSAEDMPLPDESFEVVLSQLGLQFVPDKAAAVSEMHRVLAPGGRLVLSVTGPTPPPMVIFDEALSEHISPEVSPFVNMVFSLHDPDELRELIGGAGFRDVSVQSYEKKLRLPPPRDFMWQYVHSTPLAGAVAQADDDSRAALERDVVAGWQEFVEGDGMTLAPNQVVVTARK